MRKRWRARFSSNRSGELDSPTSMPVSIPRGDEASDTEIVADEVRQSLFGGSLDFDFLDESRDVASGGSATDI